MSAARVLLVDDEPAQVDNLREILEDEGYSVRTALTCAAAREAAKAGFEVALVDLRLPDGDGTELAQELRAMHPGEVVLFTGNATVETAAAAVRAGVFAYLIKPTKTEQLLLTVEQALRQVRLRVEGQELARRAQLAERLATVGTLTAGLSHEIRNPLNAASLHLSILDRRLKKLPDDQQQQYLEPLGVVRGEIARLERTLSEFLGFAKPKPFRPERLEVAPLLERVLTLLTGAAKARDVAITPALELGLFVNGSADQLQQVVVNLVLNAVDAAGRGGRVELRARRVAAEVVIEVDDSGAGVPPELRDRIFEPFFTTKQNGSGLGLPMVHSIVGQHGGRVAVGESPLGGARFSVTLPAL